MGAYSIKLDRDRHFGTTGGDPINYNGRVAMFCQDGLYFDNDGELIEEMLTKEKRREIEEREAQNKALEQAKEAARESLIAAGLDPDSIDLMAVKRKEPISKEDEAEIDLDAWAAGKLKRPWTIIRAAFKKQFNIAPSNADAAKKILAERGTGFGKAGDELVKANDE